MYGKIKEHLRKELEDIRESGLFKTERIILSAQDAEISIGKW
jgi:glycine C-acetyltransferase